MRFPLLWKILTQTKEDTLCQYSPIVTITPMYDLESSLSNVEVDRGAAYLSEHVWGRLHLERIGRSRTKQQQAPHTREIESTEKAPAFNRKRKTSRQVSRSGRGGLCLKSREGKLNVDTIVGG